MEELLFTSVIVCGVKECPNMIEEGRELGREDAARDAGREAGLDPCWERGMTTSQYWRRIFRLYYCYAKKRWPYS